MMIKAIKKLEVAKHSAFTYDYASVFDDTPDLSNVDIEHYSGVEIIAEVRESTKRHDRSDKPKCMRESVISKLIREHS